MDNDFNIRLGKRIAAARRAAGLTQEVLAELSEVGASYIARIEAGERKPTLDVLVRVGRALRVDIGDLLKKVAHAPRKIARPEIARLTQLANRLDVGDVRALCALAERLDKSRVGSK